MKFSIRFLVLSFCIIGAATSTLAGTDEGYLFNFEEKSTTWTIMLPCPDAQKVFLNSMTAVDILSVVCDGKPIIPKLFSPAEPPLHLKGEAYGRTVVYQFSLGFFQCWDDLQDKEGYGRLRSFDIPTNAKIVSVKYRVRFPDGTASEELVACFVASDQQVHVLSLPKGK